ncbi:MAG TPA: hypothetical protein VLA74_01130 [Nitrososphaeraceae archaeon]|nr:hypothetical protein [Nitrososphaeraceae archaeon]
MNNEKIQSLIKKYKKEIGNRRQLIDYFYSKEEPTRDYYAKIKYNKLRQEKDKVSIEIGIFLENIEDLEELLK